MEEDFVAIRQPTFGNTDYLMNISQDTALNAEIICMKLTIRDLGNSTEIVL